MNKKLILTGFAIFISLIFLMAPVGAASHSISPDTTSSTNYQPNPSLNTQATWNTFNSSMGFNEYINTTGNPAYLNVQNGTGNYISIIPGDIKTNLTYPSYAVPSKWGVMNTVGDIQGASYVNNTYTEGYAGNDIYLNITTNANDPSTDGLGIIIDLSDMPSSTLSYDYFTLQYIVSGKDITGMQTFVNPNDNAGNGKIMQTLNGTGSGYISYNLQQTGINATTYANHAVEPEIYIDAPATTAAESVSLEITGMAITTYPLSLGTNSTGGIVNGGAGTIQLSTFKPAQYVEVVNSGYSENLSQPMSLTNYTTTQTPITSGNYIEQVGYQATFSLPSAPDLSYGEANFTLPLSVPASQFQVLEVNGVSYLSTLGNKTNGTAELLSSVNPTSTISYLAYVDYTATQWQSISHPAGIFTYDGIAYYYFIAIGAIAGIIGLAVAAKRANTKAKQAEKVDHTIRRGR